MVEILAIRRRAFVAGGAGVVAAAGLGGSATSAQAQAAKPLPGYIGWKDAGAMIGPRRLRAGAA